MKPKDIIIATAVILIISSLLGGCNSKSNNNVSLNKAQKANILAMVKKAEMAKKEVNMVFASEKSEGKVKVTISLNNPNKKPITSVESWLSFDPKKLEGLEINTSKSAFKLTAPYKNTFNNKKGLVMLGRAGPKPIIDQKIHMAVVTFNVLAGRSITLDSYDYREDLTGHTSANIHIEGKPYNVLTKPASPALVIK